MNLKKERDIGIDLVKCIAILGVLIIHMCPYTGELGSFEWGSSLFWGSITRGSVPLFLMASGALFLDSKKELSLKKLFFKNILRIVIAMLVWAFLYKLYHLVGSETLNVQTAVQAFKEVLLFNQEFHFYYLHIIIVFYVLLPIIRVFVQNADVKTLRYALGVWLVLGVIYPSVDIFWPFNLLDGVPRLWRLNMVYCAIGYGMLGYYLKKYPLSSVLGLCFAVFGVCLIFTGTYVFSLRDGFLQEDPFLSGMGFGATMLSTGVFVIANNVKVKNAKITSVAIWLSGASFCVYLCHMQVSYILNFLGINATFAHPAISVPCMALAVLAISLVVYFVLSKIPVIKKWII